MVYYLLHSYLFLKVISQRQKTKLAAWGLKENNLPARIKAEKSLEFPRLAINKIWIQNEVNWKVNVYLKKRKAWILTV